MEKRKPLELYIHIPFCMKKCYYCDFLSAPASAAERAEYVKSLCEKIRAYGDLAEAYRIVSIFVGGGTPSVLEPKQMESIFESIRETFFIEKDAEITVEMNPGTVTEEKLMTYRKVGINRLSIGLQSVNDHELKMLGRIHSYQEFLETYQMARDVGFQNVNIDLISAIPGQTVESWEKTLRTVAELCPEHISAYSLIIEEGTPFFEVYEKNCNGAEDYEPLPDEETERRIYQDTKRILESYGYERYEISNYAKQGYECRHNIGYWERAEYLGIGDGAASLIENQRWVEGSEKETLSKKEQIEETMFLGLRKSKGVSKKKYEETFGERMEGRYGKVIVELKNKGLLSEDKETVRLSEKGIDVSNYVMSEFLIDS